MNAMKLLRALIERKGWGDAQVDASKRDVESALGDFEKDTGIPIERVSQTSSGVRHGNTNIS